MFINSSLKISTSLSNVSTVILTINLINNTFIFFHELVFAVNETLVRTIFKVKGSKDKTPPHKVGAEWLDGLARQFLRSKTYRKITLCSPSELR